MNKPQKIFILPETREDIKSFIEAAKIAIIGGEQDPLRVLMKIKTLESIADALKKDNEIAELIDMEASKYPENTIEIYGCKFQKQERKNYDFSECGDTQLNLMYMQKAQIDALVKGRENWLKSLSKPTPDIETGEIIIPPTHTSKSILAVTLPKN
jgi:hypothetical protein